MTEQELLVLLNDKRENFYVGICKYLGPCDASDLAEAIGAGLDEDFRVSCGDRKPSITATGHWDEEKQMTCVDMKISIPGLEPKRIQVWLNDRPRIGKLHYGRIDTALLLIEQKSTPLGVSAKY